MSTALTEDKRVLLGLSLLVALLAAFLYHGNRGFAFTVLVFAAALVFFFALFWLLLHGIKIIYPGSRKWGVLSWIVALGAAGVVITLLFPFLAGIFWVQGPASSPSSPGTFSTYQDPALGFRISYPGTWHHLSQKDPNSDFITNIAFISSDGKTAATVQVTDLTGPGYRGVPLDLWTTHSIEVLRSNTISSQFTLLRNETTVFAGYPAEHLEYTVVLNSGEKIRTDGYLLEAGSKGYNIGFTSGADTFGEWSGTEQQIFSSFQVTG